MAGSRSRLVMVLALTAATLAVAATPAPAAERVATLAPGESTFWDGPYTEQAAVGSGELCGIAGPCWNYELGVEPGAARLRVAIDWASSEDWYQLELFDPSGQRVGTLSGYGSWSDELFAADPVAGTWTVRVVPEAVTATSFEARAKLEAPCRGGDPPPCGGRRNALPPNLQVLAPWNPTLTGPAAVGPTSLLIHQPLDVLGFHPLSCSLDETVLNGVEECLRFNVGPMNVARGPFEVAMDLATVRPNEGGHLEGDVTQRIYRRDGSYSRRNAGTFVAHEQHLHFHAQDLLHYRLLRVGPGGQLEPTGVGNKASFCTLDLMIPFFRKFTTQGPKFRGPSPCAVPPEGDTKLVMGISPGWADVYTWDLADQYVDFGAGGQGRFVIRAQVDAPNTIRETNERDNFGYALIEIVGDEVALLERGIGKSPWDPRKRVLPIAP
jgi:hypothetical protein